MSLELLFLGTGTSAGVPMIGCHCEVCTSDDPHDQRSRTSVLVTYHDQENQQRRILIDTAPELRLQMIRHRVDRIDGVLYTHAHADHIFGLDDLRRFNAVMKAPVYIHGEQRVMTEFRRMFRYIFEPHKNENDSFIPQLIPLELDETEPFDMHGATWTPLRLMHGRLPILGFRIDYAGSSIAYCTDVSSIPPETWPLLENLDVLVLDALRYRHHPTHLTVNQAIEIIEQVKPKQAYLTHIAHEIKHAELDPQLPENIAVAYDGLSVKC